MVLAGWMLGVLTTSMCQTDALHRHSSENFALVLSFERHDMDIVSH